VSGDDDDRRRVVAVRKPAASAVLGVLLDRSLVQIAAAAADARVFDREVIRAVSDVWDNNTFPLFHVAIARTPWGREGRARAALEWMAALGAQRRAWMVEQAAAAGFRLELLLSPPAHAAGYARDYRGLVMPRPVPLTGETAQDLGTDYDLADAEVRTLQVERAGDRLVGFMAVAAGRRFPADTGRDDPAELNLWLDEVVEACFDSRDTSPVTLSGGPGGIVIGIGADGFVRANAATAYCEDPDWHLSAAGRAADRTTPPRGAELPRPAPGRRPERLDGAALVAATVLRAAMWEIRSVRYPSRVGKVPVPAFCQAFSGAGAGALAAGSHLRPGRRENAFRRLVETWINDADPASKRWLVSRLQTIGDEPQTGENTQAWLATLASRTASLPRPGRQPGHGLPAQAELRLASYTAGHTRYGVEREASTVLNLAVPSRLEDATEGLWQLRALEINNTSRFRLSAGAFSGPGGPEAVVAQDTVRSFTLHGGALTVSAGEY
jgi:hypothetical protein